MKQIFSLLIALCLLFGLASCGRGNLNYTTDDITKYYDLALSEFTGGTYEIDLPDKITEEDAWSQLRYLQLYHSTRRGSESLDVYLRRPEFGDTVFFYYDVVLEEGGDPVFSNLFTKAGASSATVGAWEFPQITANNHNALIHNKAVSDSLAQTMPATRVLEGTVEKGDIVVIDYRILNSNNVVTERANEFRIDMNDLSLYEHIFPKEMLSSLLGKTLGEEVKIVHTQTPEGSDKAVTNTYAYTVTHKVQETYTTVKVELHEKAFNDTYSDTLQGLNGKTVYVRYTTARFIDFDVPDLDSTFYIDTLGLETKETDPEKIEAEAIKQVMKKLEDDQLMTMILPVVRDVIFEKILSRDDRVKKYPKDQVDDVYKALCREAQAEFEKAKQEAVNMGMDHGYKNIDDFAAEYFGYDEKEYSSMHAFCKEHAKYVVELRLLNFAIAQLGGIRYDSEKAEAYYATYLEYIIEAYKDPVYGLSLSEEELAAIRVRANGSETERLYLEYINILMKYYSVYQGLTLTEEGVQDMIGTMDKVLLEGLLSITEVNVQQYLYANNTWIDKTP